MARKNSTQALQQTPSALEAAQTTEARHVTVRARQTLFVDLIKDVNITNEAKSVEWHPWLQAQIDSGLLIEE